MPDIPQDEESGPPTANINLKVSDDEKWAFKTWCAQHRMTQVEAFRRAFSLLKDEMANEGRSRP